MSMPPAAHIFILPSIHHVLKGEQVLQNAGLPMELIPVPKEVNPDCGMALETGPDSAEMVRGALVEAGLTIEAEYQRNGRTFSKLSLPET